MTAPSRGNHEWRCCSWLGGLRLYLGVTLIGNLAWESLHLPLYTIWQAGTLREQASAVLHCTFGDLAIAVSALAVSLLITGRQDWPQRRFWPVAVLTIVLGVAYTVYSEWLNVVVRAAWAYSDLMPRVPLFGFETGLSPLLQWIFVPLAAFATVSARRWPKTRPV